MNAENAGVRPSNISFGDPLALVRLQEAQVRHQWLANCGQIGGISAFPQQHPFTLSASHRALVEGAALAKALGKSCPDCDVSAPRVLCFLQSFWVDGYIDSNINVNDGRTGKDANSILSSIHTFDPQGKCTDSTFQPCSERALANHKAVVDSFRSIYGINKDRRQGQAAAVGRYSEDVYYEGNPWYLTTLAAAEQLYSAIYQWKKAGSINTKTFKSIIEAANSYADGFVAVAVGKSGNPPYLQDSDLAQTYTPADGSLAEQFDKSTRSPKSAVHLTWSYAAFLSATERRAGIVSPSWGEIGANTVPPVCELAPSCDSMMTFNVRNVAVSNEDVFVVGSITELANWSPENGIPLKTSSTGTSEWTAKIKIPSNTLFEYKYIKRTSDRKVTWESDPNRRATSSSDCGSSGTLNDEWR